MNLCFRPGPKHTTQGAMGLLRSALFTFLIHAYFYLVNIGFSLYVRLFIGPKKHVPFPVRTCPEEEIYFLSAVETARRIRGGQLASQQLVQAYVNRVRLVNPELNAVVFDLFEEALEQVLRSRGLK